MLAGLCLQPSDEGWMSRRLPIDQSTYRPTTDRLIYLPLSNCPFFHPILPPSLPPSIHPSIHRSIQSNLCQIMSRRQTMQDQSVLCPSQGGGFGAGVVKAFEAHVLQCENSHCEWKRSAEAKPHWETQSFVVDVTLEGDSENQPACTLEHPHMHRPTWTRSACPTLAYTQSKSYRENVNQVQRRTSLCPSHETN